MPSLTTLKTEKGSMALLGIAFAMLALASTLVILSAGAVYLSERRLTWLAESTALSVLDSSEGNLGQNLNSYAEQFVGLYEGKGLRNIRVISVGTQDGKTVKVELCGNFEGLFGGYLFRVGAPVCSEGLARLGR